MNNLQIVDLNTAQEKLPELVEQAMRNRPVTITKDDVPVAKIERIEVKVKKIKSKKGEALKFDPLLKMIGAGGKGGGSLSENVDEIYLVD